MNGRFWLIPMAVAVFAVSQMHAQAQDAEPAFTLEWQGLTIRTSQDILGIYT